MKKIVLVSLLLISAILLSSCAGGGSTRGTAGWTGLAADADYVYMADGNAVYAIDLKNGQEVWRFPAESSTAQVFFAPPVLTEDGQVLIGSEGTDHSFYSLDIKTGKENWAKSFTEAKDRWIASPLVHNELIYAPNADGFLYVLNMEGKLIDKIDLGGELWTAPVTDGTSIYVTSHAHQLQVVNIATRKITQTLELDGAIPGGLTNGENAIYFGSFSKKLTVISNGRQATLTETPNWIWGAPLLDGDTLYYADLNGNAYSYNLSSAQKNWEVALGTAIIASPVLFEGNLIVATEGTGKGALSGTIIALNTKDGSQVWEYATEGKVYSNMITAKGLILVSPMSAEFHLIALDMNGKEEWTFTPGQ